MLLNHQLYKETRHAIRRLPTKSYVLDVIIANELKLCRCWKKRPRPFFLLSQLLCDDAPVLLQQVVVSTG
jgi:hypothetical protein